MVDHTIGCSANLIAKIGEKLIAEPSRHLGYVIYYNNYVESLNKELNTLIIKSHAMKLEVEEARRNGEIVAPKAALWFASVDIILEESMRFLEYYEVQENKGWFPNVKKRYILSKQTKRKTQKVAALKADVFHKISYPAPRLAVGNRSIGGFMSFESRVPTINHLIELLKDDTTRIIPICGIGGSGKTTMVKEVARRVREKKLFDEIIMVVVSQKHDLMKVQEDLAKWLGLRFNATSLEGRANELWMRLLQSKKGNLVILDDVWKHIDLKNIGIPFGEEYKNCKVVLTSRTKEPCKAMGCQFVLELDVLTPSEAWSLLVDIVGDRLQRDPDLCETASEIAKRCGGLPIVIVRLGTILKGEWREAWNDTLLKLQRPTVPTSVGAIKERVYESLQNKYDIWEEEDLEAKKFFLLTYRVYIENLKMPGLKP